MSGLYLPKNLRPEEVQLSDITIRDGIQALETIISAQDKVRFLEGLILAGFKRVEATNFAHPKLVPFFNDADEVLKGLYNSEVVGDMLKHNGGDVELTAVTITKRAVDRALEAYHNGYGPDRILQMVSTCPQHQKANSGMTHDEYWKMTEECIKMAHEAGILVNGTVSTIWGSPFKEFEPTLGKAVEFVKTYLDLGADDIEHADHDGSLTNHYYAFKYFSLITNPAVMGMGDDGREYADPKLHVAHFHTQDMASGLRNVLGALRAGIIRYESTLAGTGGEPANKVDGVMIEGREKYYTNHFNQGLVSTEDVVQMMYQLGIETGIDKQRLTEVSSDFNTKLTSINRSKLQQGIMPNRSYIVKEDALPNGVMQLYIAK